MVMLESIFCFFSAHVKGAELIKTVHIMHFIIRRAPHISYALGPPLGKTGPSHTIKDWYGCMVSELHTFIDTFRDFSSGDIDKGVPISPEYWCSSVKVSKTKTLSADRLEVQADLIVKKMLLVQLVYLLHFSSSKGSKNNWI